MLFISPLFYCKSFDSNNTQFSTTSVIKKIALISLLEETFIWMHSDLKRYLQHSMLLVLRSYQFLPKHIWDCLVISRTLSWALSVMKLFIKVFLFLVCCNFHLFTVVFSSSFYFLTCTFHFVYKLIVIVFSKWTFFIFCHSLSKL